LSVVKGKFIERGEKFGSIDQPEEQKLAEEFLLENQARAHLKTFEAKQI
jgi:hypothetical protein